MEGRSEEVRRRGEGRGGKGREEQSRAHTVGNRDPCALLGTFQEKAASFNSSNFMPH